MARNSRNNKRGKSKIIDLEATQVDEAEKAASENTDKLDNISEKIDDVENKIDEAAEKPAEVKVVKKTSGVTLAGMLGSAVIGGGLALGGAGALNQAGMLKYIPFASGLVYGGDDQSGENAAVAGLEQKISEINAEIENLAKAREDVGVVAIPTKFAARVDAIEKKLNSPATSNIGGEQLAAMNSKIDVSSDKARIAVARATEALEKISQVSQKVIAGTGGADEATIKAALANETNALSEKIAAIETKLGEVAKSGGEAKADPKITAQLGGFTSQLTGITAKIDELTKQTSRIDALEKQSVEIKESVSATNKKIENDIMAPMADVQSAAKAALAGQQVAKSVSARALSSAIEQGGSFAGELSAAEALVGKNDIITELKPLAQTGVKTPQQLAKSFVPVMDGIITQQAAPAEDAGVFAKFVSNAKSIVKVRPAGRQDGDDAVAIASRVADGLETGNLAAAKTEWESLPEGAKALSADWVKSLDERLKAKELVTQLISVLSSESKG